MYLGTGLFRVTLVVWMCLLAGVGLTVGQEEVSVSVRFVDVETGFGVEAAINQGTAPGRLKAALRHLPGAPRLSDPKTGPAPGQASGRAAERYFVNCLKRSIE